MRNLTLLLVACLLWSCGSEIKKENRKLVEVIDHKVKSINHNHRISIIEDDFVQSDSASGILMKAVL